MSLFRYEHHRKPIASRAVFLGRVAANTAVAICLIGVSLAFGMTGYHLTEQMSWLDAYLNAAMLLGGMGPVTPIESEAGKLFAGSYALYCGLVVVITAGVILAPILHRVLHAMHVECD